MFSVGALVLVLKAISLTGVSSKLLQCDHDQLVCPLQNITCQCVATGSGQSIVWTLHSETVANFDINGNCVLDNCLATIEVLDDGLSSKLVFPAGLKPNGPLTITCRDGEGNSSTISYSIVEPPGPPVINFVIALNSSSANLSWTPPPYNCSLSYLIEVVNSITKLPVVTFTTATSLIIAPLIVGESYIFRVTSVDAAERMSNWSQPVSLAMKVLAPVEIVTATVQVSSLMKYVTAEWKVNHSSSIPLVLYYIVYHNVTMDGHQGIIVYDTSVTIKVANDQYSFVANVVYVVQVAAVNAIGQSSVSETTLNVHVVGQESTSQTPSMGDMTSSIVDDLFSSILVVPVSSCEAIGSHYPLSVLLSAVCVSGVVFSALTALSISVIVCLKMKKRQGKQEPAKATPIHSPVYDTITKGINKENIELTGNVAYEQVTVQP